MKRAVPPVMIREPAADGVVHPHPLMDRILRARGIKSLDEVSYELKDLLPPNLKGMDQAVAIIAKHILADSHILILGDYDCDGATATSIAVEGMQLLGAKHVDFLVPDRGIHGYGLTPAIVELAAERKPDLIVTVDNGIASFAGAEAVKALKHPCELVITDHHLPADSGELPDADAIVNPNQPGCSFPSKAIAGCGVMFYTILALRNHMREQGVFSARNQIEPNLEGLLDLVALGTVADVVPLDRNNRIIVSAGLARINGGDARPGIAALLAVAKKEVGFVTAQDFGFGVGPRLNAAGRLEDMSTGIRCLLSQDRLEAAAIAEELDELNIARREIEKEMTAEASVDAAAISADGRDGIVLYNPEWHEGVVGIVASRIKEQVNRPAICFTDTKKARDMAEAIDAATSDKEREAAEAAYAEREIKGSCRSVPGVHLKHALDRIHKRHPEVLTKFGGHAMAAGVTIPAAKLEQFRELFDAEVRHELTDEIRSGLIHIDLVGLQDEDRSVDTAHMITAMGPWGQHFPEPVFKDTFLVEDVRVMKDAHLKLRLRSPDGESTVEGVVFNVIETGDQPELLEEVDVVYRLDINRFRGRESLQLMIEYISPRGQALQVSPAPPVAAKAAEVADQRRQASESRRDAFRAPF